MYDKHIMEIACGFHHKMSARYYVNIRCCENRNRLSIYLVCVKLNGLVEIHIDLFLLLAM